MSLAALSRRKRQVLDDRYQQGGDLMAAAQHLDGDEKATSNLLLRLRSTIRDLCTGKASLTKNSARKNTDRGDA